MPRSTGPVTGESPEHIHFVGVCGTAMAGVAAELHRRGLRVTGSDASVYPPMSTYLAEAGVKVMEGFSAGNLDPAPDLVVIGNAISRGNAEAEAVLDAGLPHCSLPELLHWRFLQKRRSLVITGTHGKTTTSSLCAWALREAGRDPSWLIGGIPLGLQKGFHVGGGDDFVLEGDEYDTAFFDKRSKFLHYAPRVVLLNNLEYDHADIFDDLESLRRTFRHLLRVVPRSGRVVANIDDPEVRRLTTGAPCPVVGYSTRDASADWYGSCGPGVVDVRGPNGQELRLRHDLVGAHQGWNVLGAAACLHALGLDGEEISRGIATFRGVKRRAELRGEVRGIRVYDDFAHHPTAVKGTLEGFRQRFPGARIWAVLEPRSNTMRRRVFQEPLASAFQAADVVCLRRMPGAEKIPEGERLDVDRLCHEIVEKGRPAKVYEDAAEIVGAISVEARSGDVVVVMSNGGFEGIHERLLEAFGTDP